MTSTLLRTTAIVPLALLALTLTTSSAEAAHKYKFTGVCRHFHGEAHLIDALDHMDAAAFAPSRHRQILETVAAKREVLQAYRESCDALAKRELIAAVRYLSRYVGTSASCDLDAAAEAIGNALAAEGRIHAAPVAHPIHHPVVRPVIARPVIARPVVARPILPSTKYCYTGTCYGFHGEQHVIRALEKMDAALFADCEVSRVAATRAAMRELAAATNEFCVPHARHKLVHASDRLNRYLYTGRPGDLDDAARLATSALALERSHHAHDHLGHGHSSISSGGIRVGGNRISLRIGF